jgi:hypothetical protein
VLECRTIRYRLSEIQLSHVTLDPSASMGRLCSALRPPASSPAACYPGEFHVTWDIQYNSPVSFSNTLRIIVTLFRCACSDTCHLLRAADSSDPSVHYVSNL